MKKFLYFFFIIVGLVPTSVFAFEHPPATFNPNAINTIPGPTWDISVDIEGSTCGGGTDMWVLTCDNEDCDGVTTLTEGQPYATGVANFTVSVSEFEGDAIRRMLLFCGTEPVLPGDDFSDLISLGSEIFVVGDMGDSIFSITCQNGTSSSQCSVLMNEGFGWFILVCGTLGMTYIFWRFFSKL